jgi:hypothetical protein
MVKTIAGRINDELYEKAIAKGNEIGLKNSAEIIRYAFAIMCGYSQANAKVIAKIKPELPFSEIQTGE